jgi:hypothetical protein
MTFERQFYSLLDKFAGVRVDASSVTNDVAEAAAYRAIPAIQEMNTEFSALDTKASALVSHLSLMIAAISILHSSVAAVWLKIIFLLEIIFYVCTLIIVIRVIYYIYYSEIGGNESASTDDRRGINLMIELKKRMIYYRLAHNLTNVGTLMLIASLILTVLFSGAAITPTGR